MICSFISILITYIVILLAIAFFTLLERKGLGYFQIRKGPNKVGIMGLPQPLADAVKLFSKEITKPTFSNQLPYFIAPSLSLILALMMWQLYPSSYSSNFLVWGLLYFLCVSSLNVYGTLVAGWSSNSKYAMLGALRAVAQTISYEISLALILLFSLCIGMSFNLMVIQEHQYLVWITFLFLPLGLVWLVSCLAETNRAPFDFAEGESELVSGFNIEYSAGTFALIFMAEYGNILFMSLLTAVLFFGGSMFFNMEFEVVLLLKTFVFSFIFIWARGALPRFRYDLLMGLTWKSFLPVSLAILMFGLIMKSALGF
uniref:NADH dehydrogenase subunit 1 n=1 Tax=Ennucula tenuis TaxID=106224 RepID=UPI00286D683B|nr:NADH dehydrogenase subunit 1 [Ennucula tenuis]WLV28173.1 NADH dehydrogenase subunit 1 [Ennucula tenuis]